MQSRLDSMNVEEADVEEEGRAVAEPQTGTVTQQALDGEMEMDEMERLLEENEDLKVWWNT